jgi:hypothetical protein
LARAAVVPIGGGRAVSTCSTVTAGTARCAGGRDALSTGLPAGPAGTRGTGHPTVTAAAAGTTGTTGTTVGSGKISGSAGPAVTACTGRPAVTGVTAVTIGAQSPSRTAIATGPAVTAGTGVTTVEAVRPGRGRIRSVTTRTGVPAGTTSATGTATAVVTGSRTTQATGTTLTAGTAGTTGTGHPSRRELEAQSGQTDSLGEIKLVDEPVNRGHRTDRHDDVALAVGKRVLE